MLCFDLPQGLQFVYSFDEPRDITGLDIGIDTSVFAGSMVQKGLNPYTSLSGLSCRYFIEGRSAAALFAG